MFDTIYSIFDFLVGLLTYQDSSLIQAVPLPPAVGAALISGGASLLGGLFGSNSQSQANRTNLKIARETNALNYKMFQEQNSYNKEMWQLNNEYNDPSNQAQRLQAAGFNPYLSGDVTSGSSSSAPSSVPLPNLVTPQIQPNMAFANSLPQIGNALSGIPLQQAQIDNLDANSVSTVIDMLLSTGDATRNWKAKDLQNWLYDITKWNMKTRSDYDAKIARQEWLESISNAKYAEAQAEIADWTSFMLPEQSVIDLNQKVANVFLSKAQEHLSYEQAKLSAKQVVKETLLAEGVRLSNRQLEQLTPLIIDEKEYNNLLLDERLFYLQNYGTENPTVQSDGNFNFGTGKYGIGVSGSGYLPVHSGHRSAKKGRYSRLRSSNGSW